MILKTYEKLLKIATLEFKDIVTEGKIFYLPSGEPLKLRLFLIDSTIIDIWLSVKENYSYHWERKPIKDEIYRYNNAPHEKWKYVKTFPRHFHNGKEEIVRESKISNRPEKAIREVLLFVRNKLRR